MQARLYGELTWIATAIDAVSNAYAATVEFSVHNRNGEGLEDIPNHPFELLLQSPNPLDSRYEFLRNLSAWYSMTGNAYLWQNKASETAAPDELWVLPSNRVKPVPDNHMYLRGYLIDTGSGTPIALEVGEVCHVKTFNPFNPFIGLSALQTLMIIGQGDVAQQKWGRDLYTSESGRLPGALAFSDPIGDPEWDAIKREKDTQAKRAGIMMLRGVGKGVSWINMAANQKEMQFLEARQFTKEEIWQKLAPGLLNILDKNVTEANATAGKSVFLEYTLWPIAASFGDRFTKDIMPSYGDNLVCQPDDFRETNRLVDLAEQSEYSKYHTVNEVRAEYYGDEPIDGGDVPVGKWEGVKEEPEPAPELAPLPAPMLPEPMPTEAQQEEEIKAWQSYALKRWGQKSREFEPRVLPLFRVARIKHALKVAATEAEARAVFERELRLDPIARLDRALEIVEQLR